MENTPDHYDDQEPTDLTDAERVTRAVEAAQLDGGPIPHEVARVIAALLHDGPALSLLATTGGVDLDGLSEELHPTYYDEHTPPEVRAWIDALREYVAARDDFGPVKGWQDLWVSDEYGDDECCTTCSEHYSHPHAPTCPRLMAEPAEQEPGLDADLMALLNKDASTVFDMSERRRIADAVEAYIKANYVSLNEAAAMNTAVRVEELNDMQDVLEELGSDPDTLNEVKSIGAMVMHLTARTRSISKIVQRKPD
ncbi:hypothetical protein ACFZAD_24460 [Streptomyces iakyrus]|uniref:hypothetical protein n=1 Tax=Streptomyces iakyrus TaxID=68219 RepID=UPI0036E81E34